MTAFLLYIIKSTCCLILFYLGYKALLSNETFYRFNRCVLLVGMLVCLSLPLIRIQTAGYGPLQQPLLQLEAAIAEEMGEGSPSLSADIRQQAEVAPTAEVSSSVEWGTVFLYLYAGGIVTGCGLLLVSSVSLYLLIRSGRKVMRDDYCLVLLCRDLVPFNWGNYILLSERDYREHPEEILIHEQVHCRKRHTLDLVFAEAVILLHWFNPAAWLLKKELQEVHEFQADSGVLQSGIDATKYQLLLVKKAVSASSYTFANSFNHSKIKKRITMMLKEKSNKWARLKLVLLVPVAASALVAFARPDVSRKLELFVQNEGIASQKPANTVVLKLISEDKQTWVAYINPEDGREVIHKKLADLKAKRLSSVSITAPDDTPMGRIKDIRIALQDVYDMRNKRVVYQ